MYVSTDLLCKLSNNTPSPQTNSQIVLDHQLHAENYGFLNDQLIGAHGYRINGLGIPGGLRISLPAVSRMSSDGKFFRYNYGSWAGPQRKVIFNQAECPPDDENYHMTQEEALLCPARTRGFSLEDKTWGFFMVENVSEIKFSPRPFDQLAFDPYYKEIVRALVDTHGSDGAEFDNIVAGKGKGVVISLEGPPGSGKTLMAGKQTI